VQLKRAGKRGGGGDNILVLAGSYPWF
jgi:hypothetical protein